VSLPSATSRIAGDTRACLPKHRSGDTRDHPRYTLRYELCGVLACGNRPGATRPRFTPRAAAATAALGAPSSEGVPLADRGHRLEVRALRQAPRAAPPVHGPAEGPRPGPGRPVVHLPVVRQAGPEPAHPHLQHPVGLQAAEGRAETRGAGRRAETQAPRRGRPQAGPGEGAQAEGRRAPQAARRRGRGQAQGGGPLPVPRQGATRLRDVPRPLLHAVRVPDLPGRPGSRQAREPRGGLRRRVRGGVRRGLIRPVKRRSPW
jgi:hypothetical protein